MKCLHIWEKYQWQTYKKKKPKQGKNNSFANWGLKYQYSLQKLGNNNVLHLGVTIVGYLNFFRPLKRHAKKTYKKTPTGDVI